MLPRVKNSNIHIFIPSKECNFKRINNGGVPTHYAVLWLPTGCLTTATTITITITTMTTATYNIA